MISGLPLREIISPSQSVIPLSRLHKTPIRLELELIMQTHRWVCAEWLFDDYVLISINLLLNKVVIKHTFSPSNI